MQLPIPLTHLVLSIALIFQADSLYAAPKAGKKHNVAHHKVHAGKKTGKLSKAKKSGPKDVWERIRYGMHLARPTPVQFPLDNPLAPPLPNSQVGAFNPPLSSNAHIAQPLAKDANHKSNKAKQDASTPALSSAEQYTEQGMQKLREMITAQRGTPCLRPAALIQTTAPTANKRIRTRIDFISPSAHGPKTQVTRNEVIADTNLSAAEPALNASSAPCRPLAENIPTNLSNDFSHIDPILAPPLPTAEELEQQRIVAARLAQQAANYARLSKFINRYAAQKGYLYEVAERARPYLYHIVEKLQQHGLPLELALLPIVESSYQPTALSPKSAAGLWQFIPETGSVYNLKQSADYDERLDITTSTDAAVRYLSFLRHHYQGDWLLAIAAYNCGPGRVDKAIKQNKANGLDADYWSLQLPTETQEYVPRLLALAAIFSNPDAYGLKLKRIDNQPYFMSVKIDKAIDIKNLANKELKDLAQLANLSYEQFTRLNPGFVNPKLKTDKPISLILPNENAVQLQQHLNTMAQMSIEAEKAAAFPLQSQVASATAWKDPLSSYLSPAPGSPFNMAPEQLPSTPVGVVNSTGEDAAPSGEYKIHHSGKHETLASIAKHYQVSVDEIRAVNNFRPRQQLLPNQELRIPVK